MDEKKPLVSRLREDPFQGALLGLGVLCLWTWLVLPLGRELLTVKRQNEVRKQKLEQLALFAARWDPEQEAREKSLLEQGKRENPSLPPEAWLGALEAVAARNGLQVIRLAPLTLEGKKDPAGLEAELEGSYPRLVTFFRWWEARYPGVWTREGRLEAREKGEKVLFHGKFITGPVKSSKSGEIHTSY